jgi:hypothetical protein
MTPQQVGDPCSWQDFAQSKYSRQVAAGVAYPDSNLSGTSPLRFIIGSDISLTG